MLAWLYFSIFEYDTLFQIHARTITLDFTIQLEGTACYAGLLLAPAEGFGMWPRHFALWAKKKLFMLSVLVLGNFGVG